MNETQINKIQQFANDETMFIAVRDFVENEIAKPSPDRDVQNLAAKMIAIEILNKSWNELRRFKPENMKEQIAKTQIGL